MTTTTTTDDSVTKDTTDPWMQAMEEWIAMRKLVEQHGDQVPELIRDFLTAVSVLVHNVNAGREMMQGRDVWNQMRLAAAGAGGAPDSPSCYKSDTSMAEQACAAFFVIGSLALLAAVIGFSIMSP